MTIRRSPGVLVYHFVSKIVVFNAKTIYSMSLSPLLLVCDAEPNDHLFETIPVSAYLSIHITH